MKKTLHIECVGETYSYRTRLTLDDVLGKGRKMVEEDGEDIPKAVDLMSRCLREPVKRRTRSEYQDDEVFTKNIIESFLPGYIYWALKFQGDPREITNDWKDGEEKSIIAFPAVTRVVTNGREMVYVFGLGLWSSYTEDFDDGWKEILGRDNFFDLLLPDFYREYYGKTGADVRIPEDTVFRDDRPKTRQIVDPKINPRRLNPLFRTENPYIGDRKDNLDKVNVRVKRNSVNRKKAVSRVASR